MTPLVSLTVFFLDGTKVTFRYPRQSGTDAATILANIKRAIEADKLVLEADGDLLVIPFKSVAPEVGEIVPLLQFKVNARSVQTLEATVSLAVNQLCRLAAEATALYQVAFWVVSSWA
jgi:hypothetical protein